jgi:hypothetical protein
MSAGGGSWASAPGVGSSWPSKRASLQDRERIAGSFSAQSDAISNEIQAFPLEAGKVELRSKRELPLSHDEDYDGNQ